MMMLASLVTMKSLVTSLTRVLYSYSWQSTPMVVSVPYGREPPLTQSTRHTIISSSMRTSFHFHRLLRCTALRLKPQPQLALYTQQLPDGTNPSNTTSSTASHTYTYPTPYEYTVLQQLGLGVIKALTLDYAPLQRQPQVWTATHFCISHFGCTHHLRPRF